VGLGRAVLSYPRMLADAVETGRLQTKLICRTFSDCTTAPRNGLISGCYPLDRHYAEKPEAATLKPSNAVHVEEAERGHSATPGFLPSSSHTTRRSGAALLMWFCVYRLAAGGPSGNTLEYDTFTDLVSSGINAWPAILTYQARPGRATVRQMYRTRRCSSTSSRLASSSDTVVLTAWTSASSQRPSAARSCLGCRGATVVGGCHTREAPNDSSFRTGPGRTQFTSTRSGACGICRPTARARVHARAVFSGGADL